MDESRLLPFADEAKCLLRHCKLPLHAGRATVDSHGDPYSPISRMLRQVRESIGQEPESTQEEFEGAFFVPADSNCRIFLRWDGKGRLGNNWGVNLKLVGSSDEGPFTLICPRYYVRVASALGERPGWAVASPVNEPAVVSYGNDRPIAKVEAVINNFDFDGGNVGGDAYNEASPMLRVVAAGKAVDFTWRSERTRLRQLADAGLIDAPAFVTFSFNAWPGASEKALLGFANSVSTLLAYVVGQHTGIPVVSFIDPAGHVVRRTLNDSVESAFRRSAAFPIAHADDALPMLFQQSFETHCQMQQSDLWRRMPAYYASLEDPPYLEQKYATLTSAIELLIRNEAIEGGHFTPDEASRRHLPELIGFARATLRWNIPNHYTAAERYRKTRNAVGHGGVLPDNPKQTRADFDKWKLFLCRRLLMRLGFSGRIASPHFGCAGSSAVDDFSEEHNSFE